MLGEAGAFQTFRCGCDDVLRGAGIEFDLGQEPSAIHRAGEMV